MDEEGVAAVVGAIVVLAALGIGLVYVNAYEVPRQGGSLEVQAAQRAEASLADLAGQLALAPSGPLVHEVPLRAPPAAPPLLAGVVLTPARAEGHLGLLAAQSSRLSVSVVVPAPASGVPVDDPTREPVAGGRMRVHLLGTTAGLQPMGALRATTGGAYLEATEQTVEAGAVLVDTAGGSRAGLAPALSLRGDSLAWRIPLLAGPATTLSGAPAAQATLTPGPEAALGGSRVEEVRIRVETTRLAAWTSALEEALGTRGTVSVVTTGDDAGIVDAVVLDVEPRIFVVRYQVALAERG